MRLLSKKLRLLSLLGVAFASGVNASPSAAQGSVEHDGLVHPSATVANFQNQWYSIWSTLGAKVFEASRDGLVDQSLDVPVEQQRELFHLATNFNSKSIDLKSIQFRYPFRSEQRMRKLLREMETNGLVDEELDGSYSITFEGRRIVDTALSRTRSALLEKRTASAESDYALLGRFLERIVTYSEAGRQPHDPFIQRRRAEFRLSKSSASPDDPYLDLADLLFDLIALRNLAHHQRNNLVRRYSRREALSSVSIAPLADELIANAFGQYRNNLASCQSYSFWLQTYENCRAAELELVEAGLVSVIDGRYQTTQTGTLYFLEAERLAELTFYSAWMALSPEEVSQLGSLLDGLSLE